MIIPEHHVSLNIYQEIDAVCQALFLHSDITFFIFIRFYPDGTIISLPNRPDWHKHFFHQEYYRTSQLRLIPGYHLWDAEKDFSQSIHDARLYFNIDNKFEITKKHDAYHEVFGFASSTGHRQVLNYYMNAIDELEQFAIHFKNEKHDLIERCAKDNNNRLFIGKDAVGHDEQTIKSPKGVSSFAMKITGGKAYLSKRQLQCLLYLIKGRSAFEVAQQLHISSKTVESYIAMAKIKLHANNRAELFDIAYANNLTELAKRLP